VAGNSYVFSVRDVNLFGSSADSTTASVSNTVPTTVAAPAAAFVSPTSTTLTWTPSTVAANAPAITGYNVYGGPAGTTLLTATPLAANATSYTATTAAGSTYLFNVKAVNAVGMSAAGTSKTVVNTVPTAPAAPVLVTASVVRSGTTSNDTANVTWTPVANTVNGQPVTSYIVQTASNNTFTTNLSSVTVPATGLIGTQTTSVLLARGTATAPAGPDFVAVIAVNAVGQSAVVAANRLSVPAGSLK
jgi:hypothetical protein